MAPQKIVVLGAPGVGKSYVVSNFVSGSFDAEHDVKEVRELTRNLEIDAVQHELAVTDTLDGDPKTTEAIAQTDGFIVIFSIANAESFEAAKRILDDIYKIDGPEVKIPVILVANNPDASAEKQVTEGDYSELAKKWSIPIVDWTEADPEGVTKLFIMIVQKIKEHPRPHKKDDGKGGKKKGCCSII